MRTNPCSKAVWRFSFTLNQGWFFKSSVLFVCFHSSPIKVSFNNNSYTLWHLSLHQKRCGLNTIKTVSLHRQRAPVPTVWMPHRDPPCVVWQLLSLNLFRLLPLTNAALTHVPLHASERYDRAVPLPSCSQWRFIDSLPFLAGNFQPSLRVWLNTWTGFTVIIKLCVGLMQFIIHPQHTSTTSEPTHVKGNTHAYRHTHTTHSQRALFSWAVLSLWEIPWLCVLWLHASSHFLFTNLTIHTFSETHMQATTHNYCRCMTVAARGTYTWGETDTRGRSPQWPQR